MKIELAREASSELLTAFERLLPQMMTVPAPLTASRLQALLDFPGSFVLVARADDGSIVGAATLCLVSAPSGIHARLEDVIVDETQRGRGMGAALTRAAIHLAQEYGANYLALTSNPRREAANRLYQRLGFTRWETNLYRLSLAPDEKTVGRD